MFSFTKDMLHFSKLQQQHVRQQWKILETAANENKTEQHNEHYSGSFGSEFQADVVICEHLELCGEILRGECSDRCSVYQTEGESTCRHVCFYLMAITIHAVINEKCQKCKIRCFKRPSLEGIHRCPTTELKALISCYEL